MSVSGAYPATVLDSTCTTPLTTTPSVDAGRHDGRVRQGHGAGRSRQRRPNTATVTATSVADPSVAARRPSTRSPSPTTRCWSTRTPTPRSTRSRLQGGADRRRHAVQHVGPGRGRRPAGELPERAPERRLVHRQQLPGPAPARTRASSRRTWTAAGTCSCPGRTSSTRPPARRRSSTTTCTSRGTGRRPRTTRPPPPCTASTGPGHRRGRHRAARPRACWRPSSRTRSRRTAAPRRRSPTTRTRPTRSVRGHVQGRVRRLPDRGVRHGGPPGRPDQPRVRLLRVLAKR